MYHLGQNIFFLSIFIVLIMKPRCLTKLIFLSYRTSYAAENGDYELIHCNNPETNEPEMKFKISKQFYELNFHQLSIDRSEV